MLVDSKGKKYLLISQHWSSKLGRNVNGEIKYINPITDEGKNQLTHLKDLETLIEFHQWSDNGVYYYFSDKNECQFGMEKYEILDNGKLNHHFEAFYDTSD